MPSDRFDVWAGIGAIVTSAIAVYGWLYSIGLAQLFMFMAGACFSMWAQERLEKKRRKRNREIKMTEHIYGPLHKELSSIRANLRAFQSSTDASLNNIIKDFRFSLVEDDLISRIKEFRDSLFPYTSLLNEAIRETEVHIRRGLDKHGIDGGVRFEIFAGGMESFNFPMIDLIFRDKTPLEFLNERSRLYRKPSIIVYAGQPSKSEGHFSNEHRIHQISLEILTEVRKNPLVQEQRRRREDLLKECSSLMELIKEKIVL